VLPVGGIKEKVLAAHRAGLKRVVLPERNRKDLLEEVPEEIRQELQVEFADTIQRVLELTLDAPAEPRADAGEQQDDGEAPATRARPRAHAGPTTQPVAPAP